ncbi:hypothetical protein G3I59_30390 [Amycolatopsis rubida]|uniref:Uncharacterized protein n=1 Tax=Amycolatopsis rubida TaxID=112413 RepID=A0ABX0BVZ8_9PSEU|nr:MULTISPECIES: hypothetical protein [Amycolatopsis]MYW94788.1 hypothetical protein [Amycolatopsis rubida]NEC59775.1 hypothetical protein [Amycolatopsis rubida]OAP26426.1 hypothetical protein A4R44_02413 [Amycolatopsis sp. M39]
MTEPDSASVSPEERPSRALAVGAVSVAAVSFALAVLTWLAWLLVRPRLLVSGVYPLVAEVFVLVLGALWFLALLAGVLAVVLGRLGGGKRPAGDLARTGSLLGGLTVVVALAGTIAFTVSPGLLPAYGDGGRPLNSILTR